MATYRTGTDTDGIVLLADGDTWIVGRRHSVTDDAVAFDFAAGGGRLVVHGTVASTGGDNAINWEHDDATILVAEGGVIEGATGIRGGGWGGGHITIHNAGTINGGIDVYEANARIINDGLVRSEGLWGVHLPQDGYGDGTGILVNNGTIIGDYLGVSGGTTVVNYGTIEGGDGGAVSSLFERTLKNFGSILGDVTGHGLVVNAGSIVGDVRLGDSGRYVARDGAQLDGIVFGNPYSPCGMVGNGEADHFVAGTRGDILNGRGGDDHLRGNEGMDRISGGSGDDTINGAAGADRVDGGAGDDLLAAISGSDVIAGGTGRDRFECPMNAWPHETSNATILDFEDDVDTLVLDRSRFKTVDEVLERAVNIGGDLQIAGYNNTLQIVVLIDVSKAELADDILLV